MSNHTKGPWEAVNVLGVWVVGIAETKHLITKIPAGSVDCEANARLIAAAPDLLEACKAAHTVLLTFERLDLLKLDHEQQALDLVRAAIAAAEQAPRE